MADIFGKILSKLKRNDKVSTEIKLENYITDQNSDDNYGILFNDLKKQLKQAYGEIENMPRFINHTELLKSMYNNLTTPIVLTIMGKYTIGKKTFINSFLGENIIKSDAKHGMSVFIKISYGAKRKVIAYYKNDTTKEFAIKDLKSLTMDENDKNSLRGTIKYVEICLPKKILKEVTLIQTPGLNVDDKYYIKDIKNYLKSSDIGYWINAYGKQISTNEVNAIDEVSKVIKPTIVINKINEIDEEEEEFDKRLNVLKATLEGKIEETFVIETTLVQDSSNADGINDETSYTSENTKKLQNLLLKRAEDIKSKFVYDNINAFFEKAVPDFNDAVKKLNQLKDNLMNEQKTRDSLEERKKYLKPYYDDGIKILKKKEPITTDFDLMFDAWKNDNSKEYEKIEAPLNYIKSIEGLLKELKVNERVFYNIKTSFDLYENIKQEIADIDEKVKEFKLKEDELNDEASKLNKKLDEYYASGTYKEDDKEEDWDETRKELEAWRKDLNKRIRGVDLRYMAFEEDRRDQFKRVAVMNQEIFGYIDEYNKIVSVKIEEKQREIDECNNRLKKINTEYDELRTQVNKLEKILNELKSIFKRK